MLCVCASPTPPCVPFHDRGMHAVFVQIPRTAAFSFLTSVGLPAWAAVGSLELVDAVNAGSGAYFHEDFEAITGKPASTVQRWVSAVKEGFKAAPAAPAEPAPAAAAAASATAGAGAAVAAAEPAVATAEAPATTASA